jgi:hypothetical protein
LCALRAADLASCGQVVALGSTGTWSMPTTTLEHGATIRPEYSALALTLAGDKQLLLPADGSVSASAAGKFRSRRLSNCVLTANGRIRSFGTGNVTFELADRAQINMNGNVSLGASSTSTCLPLCS